MSDNYDGPQMAQKIMRQQAELDALLLIRRQMAEENSRLHADNKRLRAALDEALDKPRHPGYVIGNHWLESAYERICAGEDEATVLADYDYVRATVQPKEER